MENFSLLTLILLKYKIINNFKTHFQEGDFFLEKLNFDFVEISCANQFPLLNKSIEFITFCEMPSTTRTTFLWSTLQLQIVYSIAKINNILKP
jgi:hypothetical protein